MRYAIILFFAALGSIYAYAAILPDNSSLYSMYKRRVGNVQIIPIDVYLFKEPVFKYMNMGMDLYNQVELVFAMVESTINRQASEFNTNLTFKFIPQFKDPESIIPFHFCPNTISSISLYLSKVYDISRQKNSFILITSCSFAHLHKYFLKTGQSSPYISQAISGSHNTMNIIEAEYTHKKLVATLSPAILKAAALTDIEPVVVIDGYRTEEGASYGIEVEPKVVKEIILKDYHALEW